MSAKLMVFALFSGRDDLNLHVHSKHKDLILTKPTWLKLVIDLRRINFVHMYVSASDSLINVLGYFDQKIC